MSHELRTPLNTGPRHGGPRLNGPLEPDQRDMMGTLQLAAKTLLALINDILDVSKIEAGKFAPQTESFELYDLAQTTVAMLRPEAAAKGLQLSLRIDPALPDRLRGWPQQFRQILLNLVANAMKFTPSGRVAVALDEVGRQRHRCACASPCATRASASPRSAQIFELFTEADEGRTRRYGGTPSALPS